MHPRSTHCKCKIVEAIKRRGKLVHLPRANRHSSLQSSKQKQKQKSKFEKVQQHIVKLIDFQSIIAPIKKLENLFQVITQRASTRIYYTQTNDLLGSKFGPKVWRLIIKLHRKTNIIRL